jgi:hypothetical protein
MFFVRHTHHPLLETRKPEGKVLNILILSTIAVSGQLRAELTEGNYLQLPSRLFSKILNLSKVIRNIFIYDFFPMAQQPLVGQGILFNEASRSHAVRHTSLGSTPLDE